MHRHVVFFVALATAGLALPACQQLETGTDYYGGDIEPLGSGFRNASSASDCCQQCASVSGCAYFSFSTAGSGRYRDGKGPAHNCWLKSSFGNRRANGGRISGAVDGPPPVAPTPSPPSDACLGSCPLAGGCPWCDYSASVASRVAALLDVLTLEEKISQVSTYTPKTVPGVARVGLPPFSYHSEGLHGVRCAGDKTVHQIATLFPQTTAMAAVGNISMVREMAAVMRVEARALYNEARRLGLGPFGNGAGLFYWSPTMNLGRDPRWGRFQESISEDPWLNGEYASAFIQEFQKFNESRAGFSGDIAIAATCKHFVAYSVETNRFGSNAVVPVQDLHATYLPPFKRCVTSGRPAQIMCSYNAINGTPACLHPLLANPTRTQWGHDGLIVSDQDTIKDAFDHMQGKEFSTHGMTQAQISALGVQAGCDLNDGATYANSLGDAVEQGHVSEADIDRALSRVLSQRFRVGAFDDPSLSPYSALGLDVLNAPEHAALAVRAAKESIALLANNERTLPLSLSKGATVAIVGPMANLSSVMQGSKSDYSIENVVVLKEGIATRAAQAGLNTKFTAGVSVSGKEVGGGTAAAVKLASSSDVTIACVGIDGSIEHEGADRASIGLPTGQLSFLQKVATASASGGGKLVVVLVNGGPLAINWLKNASSCGNSNCAVGAVVEAFEGGQGAGTALGSVLFGDHNPSGILPFTIYPEEYVNDVELTDMSMHAGGVGRTYQFFTGWPLWPFGTGLSYSNFSVVWQDSKDISSQQRTMSPKAAANSTFVAVVENHGPFDGAKTVLAFVRTSGTGGAPLKTLFGMHKVFLPVGGRTTLTFSTGAEDSAWLCPFCSVDAAGNRAIREGEFRVSVGGNAGELQATDPGVATMRVVLSGTEYQNALYA